MKPKQQIIIVAIFFISALSVYLWLRSNQKPLPTQLIPSPATQGWKNVIPGTSTAQDVEKLFGPPLKVVPENGLVTYHFSIPGKRATDQVVFTNNTASFIKEWPKKTDNRSLMTALNKFAESPTVLYGPEASSGIVLHLLPQSGVAFLANPQGDLIFETWYFPKTTTGDFIKSLWGQKYSLTEQQHED